MLLRDLFEPRQPSKPVQNAIKYSPRGAEIHVRIRRDVAARSVDIEIEDECGGRRTMESAASERLDLVVLETEADRSARGNACLRKWRASRSLSRPCVVHSERSSGPTNPSVHSRNLR